MGIEWREQCVLGQELQLASVMPSVLPSVKLACCHTSTPARNNLTTIQCELIVLRPRKRSTRSELCNPERPCHVKGKYPVSQPLVCVTSLVSLSLSVHRGKGAMVFNWKKI